MYYYKVVENKMSIGEIIDTNSNINSYRYFRHKELIRFFDKVYEFSNEYNLPIIFILNDHYRDKSERAINNLIKRFKYIRKLRILKKEMRKYNFQIDTQGYLFIDYILEKTRLLLEKNENLILPSRFNSSFFFEKVDDCKIYIKTFQNKLLNIIKVEFVEELSLKRFDNNLLSFSPSFIASDYENQCKTYLLEILLENPLIEVVFQGKYKIISNIIH